MVCLDFSLLDWIKTLLPNPRDKKKERPYSPTFFSGTDIYLEFPSTAKLRNLRHPNPETLTKYRSPQPITTSLVHPPPSPSDDTIALPSRLSDDSIVLPSPGISYNTTPPLPNLMGRRQLQSTLSLPLHDSDGFFSASMAQPKLRDIRRGNTISGSPFVYAPAVICVEAIARSFSQSLHNASPSKADYEDWVDKLSDDQRTVLALFAWHFGVCTGDPFRPDIDKDGFNYLVDFMSLRLAGYGSGREICKIIWSEQGRSWDIQSLEHFISTIDALKDEIWVKCREKDCNVP